MDNIHTALKEVQHGDNVQTRVDHFSAQEMKDFNKLLKAASAGGEHQGRNGTTMELVGNAQVIHDAQGNLDAIMFSGHDLYKKTTDQGGKSGSAEAIRLDHASTAKGSDTGKSEALANCMAPGVRAGLSMRTEQTLCEAQIGKQK